MPTTSIPQELIDKIIDIVYSTNGVRALKDLSTVSSAWRERSQEHLFKTFNLDSSTRMKKLHSEIFKPTNAAVSLQHRLSSVRNLYIDVQVTAPKGYLDTLRFFTNVTFLQIIQYNSRMSDDRPIKRLLEHFGRPINTLTILRY
jgi:hypothetical protein